MTAARRTIARTVVLAIVGVLALLALAPNAQAAAYRYWSYWSADDGAWSFSSTGPAAATPDAGAVEGWRFGITSTSGGAQDAPRADAQQAFARICGTTAPAAGAKRIALVIDPGTAADAEPGQAPGPLVERCVEVPLSATGYDVLRTTGPLRVSEGLICAVGGYPGTGCAEVVDDAARATAMQPQPATAAEPASTSTPWPAAVAVVMLAILGVIVWRLRRRTP